MGNIVLGKRPQAIEHTVTAPLPDGTQGEVRMTYRYRTLTEFAALVDGRFSPPAPTPAPAADGQTPATPAAPATPPAPAKPMTMAEATAQGLQANAAYILDIATGWNLAAPFGPDTVAQLCDELPGVALAIMSGYRQAITEGRSGN